ncbi:MAG: DPP IV N-terminal domain-containing protein [bacterium]|nr:DPP IV N-terminal domain-containing protein [bacterium]
MMLPLVRRRAPWTALFMMAAPALLLALMGSILLSTTLLASPGNSLAFVSDRAGLRNLFLADSDRRMIYPITTPNSGHYSAPQWSPDGRALMYSINDGIDMAGANYLEVLDIQFDHVRYSASNHYDILSKTWSGDGAHIGFTSQQINRYRGIVFDLNTASFQDITGDLRDIFSLSFSPDGQQIAFASSGDIYRIDLRTNTRVELTGDGVEDLDPVWSPNGEWIAFRSLRTSVWENYLMRPDGSGLRYVANGANSPDFYPVWSPDGRYIAFSSRRDGNFEIYVVEITENPSVPIQRLTHHRADDIQPNWSPDGQQLAFTSNRSGSTEIYIMNRDGSSLRRLTFHPGQDYSPAWRPR